MIKLHLKMPKKSCHFGLKLGQSVYNLQDYVSLLISSEFCRKQLVLSSMLNQPFFFQFLPPFQQQNHFYFLKVKQQIIQHFMRV